MKSSPQRLSSWLLLAGILAGFLAASWQGRQAAAYSKPDHFRRFHQRISPDTLYYPPYAMLETLALARWSPGKTLVIVGGNSILNGVGQPVDEVWTLRLQDLLGDSYVVVNLALRSAYPTQAGALVAESLLRRGLPVVYVANTNPLAGPGLAGGPPLGYLYWQARAQHRLADYAPRDAALARWQEGLSGPARRQLREEQLGAACEQWTHHQSLWHHLGYRYFFTVWNFLLQGDFWLPRARLADNEPPARPVAERFAHSFPEELAFVRGYTSSLATADAAGVWQLNESSREKMTSEIEAAFSPALRPHMLMLLDESAPPYLTGLSPAEQQRDRAVYAASAQVWRDQGIACEIAGEGFAPADYIDRVHLSSDGGAKLAALVAKKIRQLPSP